MNRLTVTKTEPVEIPESNLWYIKVVAMVRDDRSNQPAQGQELGFFHGTTKAHSNMTNEAGLCEFTYNFPVLGNVMSEVIYVVPAPPESADSVNLTLTYRKPATPPRRIDRLDPETEGDNGQYTTVVVLRDQNGQTVEGIRVWALYQEPSVGRLEVLAGQPNPPTTDRDGTTVIQWPPFEEESRRVMVVGGGAIEAFSLEGPANSLPPVRLSPEEKRGIVVAARAETSFFGRLITAFTGGYRLAREKRNRQGNDAWQRRP